MKALDINPQVDLDSYFRDLNMHIDQSLKAQFVVGEESLAQIGASINHTLLSGGKRLRPILCFLIGELFGVSIEKLETSSCAIEMIHAASLIIDDLPSMDNESVRRGQPANHLVFGEDVAIIASFCLLAKAFEIVAKDHLIESKKKNSIIATLACTVGINGMAGGQFVDLRCPSDKMDHQMLNFIHQRKTETLFTAAGKIAAIIGNASKSEMDAVVAYTRNLGKAFQLRDDIIDYVAVGLEHDAGKKPEEKSNFVKVSGASGIEKAQNRIKTFELKAKKALVGFGDTASKLEMLIDVLLG